MSAQPADKDVPVEGLDEADLNQLVEHLEAEEATARQSTLSSLESLEMWIATHPALRQMAVVENFAQVGPALLTVLRKLLGL